MVVQHPHSTTPAGGQGRSEPAKALQASLARLERLTATAASDVASTTYLFGQAAGRLSILAASLSAESASGAIGARAASTYDQVFAASGAVAGLRTTFMIEAARVEAMLAALQRPGGMIDLRDPYRPPLDTLLEGASDAEARVLAAPALLQTPLRRVVGVLDHAGVRIVLGATDVGTVEAARAALYGWRLKELARLFQDVAGAIDTYHQGILAGMAALRRELEQAGARQAAGQGSAAFVEGVGS